MLSWLFVGRVGRGASPGVCLAGWLACRCLLPASEGDSVCYVGNVHQHIPSRGKISNISRLRQNSSNVFRRIDSTNFNQTGSMVLQRSTNLSSIDHAGRHQPTQVISSLVVKTTNLTKPITGPVRDSSLV